MIGWPLRGRLGRSHHSRRVLPWRQGAHASPDERDRGKPDDLGVMVTRDYTLDDILAAYDLFAKQRDDVLKVAIKP